MSVLYCTGNLGCFMSGIQAGSRAVVSVYTPFHWLGLKVVSWFWLQSPVLHRQQCLCLAMDQVSSGPVVDHQEEWLSMCRQYPIMRCLVTGRGSSSSTMSMQLVCSCIEMDRSCMLSHEFTTAKKWCNFAVTLQCYYCK